MIASTDFDHNHAETRIITAISVDLKTLTFADALKYKHISEVETYADYAGNNRNVAMRAEVGVLTRNVVIKGDENSEKFKYGVHLMIHGHSENGSLGRIE